MCADDVSSGLSDIERQRLEANAKAATEAAAANSAASIGQQQDKVWGTVGESLRQVVADEEDKDEVDLDAMVV